MPSGREGEVGKPLGERVRIQAGVVEVVEILGVEPSGGV